LTSWSAWIQENWQEGVGRIKPHLNGGYLYGELESRVPGQLILPGRWRHIDKRIETGSGADSRYSKYAMAGHVTIGDGQTYERASFFVANNIASSGYSWYERDQWFWIYCR